MPNLTMVFENSPSFTLSSTGPRDTILDYLPDTSLLSLRLCSRALNKLTTYHTNRRCFRRLHLFFRVSTFHPTRLTALERIGRHCTKLSLVIPHTFATKITLPPRDPTFDPDRVFSLFPTPRDGVWDPDGRFSLRGEKAVIVTPAAEALWQLATTTKHWYRVFAALPTVVSLRIYTPGLPPGAGLERGIVDEALISLRRVLEDRGMVPAVLKELVFSGHAGGLWVLDPMMSWSGAGVRSAWWETITHADFTVSRKNLLGFRSWERGTVERAWREVLAVLSANLVTLGLEVDAVVGVAAAGGVECPLVDEGTVFPKLTMLRTRGFRVPWEGLGGFERLLGKRAGKVVMWYATQMDLVEGDEMWRRVFAGWELENPPTDAELARIVSREELEEALMKRTMKLRRKSRVLLYQ